MDQKCTALYVFILVLGEFLANGNNSRMYPLFVLNTSDRDQSGSALAPIRERNDKRGPPQITIKSFLASHRVKHESHTRIIICLEGVLIFLVNIAFVYIMCLPLQSLFLEAAKKPYKHVRMAEIRYLLIPLV